MGHQPAAVSDRQSGGNALEHSKFQILKSKFLPGALWVCVFAAVAPHAAGRQVIGTARTALAIVEDPQTRRPIVDLEPDDFVIQEGAASREILSVHVADYPVVVMIGTRVPGEDMPLLQKATKLFLERLGSERAIAVGTFGESPRMLAGFDAERADTMKKLDEVVATRSGDGSLLQAAGLATETLAATRSPFSAIVMLSGNPNEDRAPVATDVAEDKDAVAPVVASGAILHIIANRPSRSAAGIPTDSGRTVGFRALAEQTRGQFVTIYTAASYEAALDQIAVRMSSELMIEYLVPNESRASDVKVGVRLPGARVRGLGVAPR
jgi:hypothetical protein